MAQPLQDIQDAIIERLHAGEPVDRETLLRENPEHAEALRAFFGLLDDIGEPKDPVAQGPSRLGDFQIIREIGRGGMGIVYEAEQLSLRRRVALKILPPSLQGDPRIVERFQREAEAAARLRHPGIVPVFTVGKDAGTPFFALELVDGRSLADVLALLKEGKDAGVPPPGDARRRWAVEVAAKMADALQYAHGRGILHRDVKPGNILLDRDGTPRLTDFGLALDLAAVGLTLPGEVFGSPQYMSPEQAFRRQAPLDQRTDVYSLAVTLYEMLTLKLPYEATTIQELLGALSAGVVVPPRRRDPDIPRGLEDVLLRALKKDPAERYPDAASFALDLRAVLEGDSVTPAAIPRDRRRRRILLAAAGLLVAAAGLVAFWPRGPTERREWRTPAYSDAEGVPTNQEFVRLADGTLPAGAEAIRRWLHPQVEARSVVSRAQPVTYVVSVQIRVPLDVPRTVELTFSSEVSVNGGPFVLLGADRSPNTGLLSPGAVLTRRTRANLADVLGSALLGSEKGDGATSVKIAHRTTVRVHRARADESVDPASLGGTVAMWPAETRTYFVYDDYPPDYPEAKSGPDVDPAMRASLTPVAVAYSGIYESAGVKSIGLSLIHDNPGGPLPAACEVDLYVPGTDVVVGRATVGHDQRPAAFRADGDFQGVTGLLFHLVGAPAAAEAKVVLDFEARRIEKVRLVFRPSRRVALDVTLFDRYWGATLDATVPVQYGANRDSPAKERGAGEDEHR